ncbi:hypothetical protein [Streptomyces collinus]|uniref:hypothetical protein n=1 Tax=Streptomyces collinus TaxID=42684 RepID=UPI002943BA6B|nr:hypothetical protein [Streptomyces collinus]
MRGWTGGWKAAVVVVLLAGCGAPAGGGGTGAGPGPSETAGTGTGAAESGSSGPARPPRPALSARSSPAAPEGTTPSRPTRAPGSPTAPAGGCAAGRVEVTVSPGGPVRQRLCVRPGTVVTLVLRPRLDDRRWTAVRSSAPALVVPAGWRVDANGTAHAVLRCAGTRGGGAEVTVAARAPDVAGAARPAFTLRLDVVPYAREG